MIDNEEVTHAIFLRVALRVDLRRFVDEDSCGLIIILVLCIHRSFSLIPAFGPFGFYSAINGAGLLEF